uniref:Uncharacterized protein n=1 Tax=Arundo donax TaxID=35708 RepID=A0A0A9A8A1_ARUDO
MLKTNRTMKTNIPF